MVFARLTPADKDAFFALLDEYFASRPDMFGAGAGSTVAKSAAVSAVSSAFSSAPPPPVTNGWKRPDAAATAEISSSVGRVAAAAAALRANQAEAPASPAPSTGGFPRPPPRRAPSSSDEPAVNEASKLVQGRKFGDVDMSSGKNMFTSIRGSTAAKHATPAQIAPPTPPAFPRRNDFAPPPRRVPSTGSGGASPQPPPPPRRQTATPPEESGEWVEAMYDYSSEDPGDLDIQEGMRILVVERTSDDWWTGEANGRRGLIPAAYVKVL